MQRLLLHFGVLLKGIILVISCPLVHAFIIILCSHSTPLLIHFIPFVLLLHLYLLPLLLLHPFILLYHSLILPEPLPKYLTHILEHLCGEFDRLAVLVDISVEASLEGEAVHDAEFAPEDDAGGLQLRLLDAELAGVEAEHVRTLTQQLREHAHLQVPLVVQREVWAVDKDRLFT